MNYNFNKKWALRIFAALFFIMGIALVGYTIFDAQNTGTVVNSRGSLLPFLFALLLLIYAEFVED